MTYSLNVSGRKADALAAMRAQAESQRAGIQGTDERDDMTAALDQIEDMVNKFAGDDDVVTISASGHLSQTDTALGYGKSCGISISKANTATAGQLAGVTGIPSESPAAAGVSAPTSTSAAATSAAAPGVVTGQPALDAARGIAGTPR